MVGGEYSVWFDSTDADTRKKLYQLENLGFVKSVREKEKEHGTYQFKWELTELGIKTLKTNKNLQSCWDGGRISDLYNLLDELGILNNKKS